MDKYPNIIKAYCPMLTPKNGYATLVIPSHELQE